MEPADDRSLHPLLAQSFYPVIWMSREEEYFPCPIEFAIENSTFHFEKPLTDAQRAALKKAEYCGSSVECCCCIPSKDKVSDDEAEEEEDLVNAQLQEQKVHPRVPRPWRDELAKLRAQRLKEANCLWQKNSHENVAQKMRYVMQCTAKYFPQGTEEYYLSIKKTGRGGYPPERLHEVPLYVLFLKHNSHTLDIVYNQYCSYNGPEVRCCGLWCGVHDSDWEHVTCRVVFNDETQQWSLDRVYYGAHHSRDGLWVHADDIERFNLTEQDTHSLIPDPLAPLVVDQDAKVATSIAYSNPPSVAALAARRHLIAEEIHPVAYCAKFAHAMYPEPGTWWVAWGFCRDVCDRGFLWKAPLLLVDGNSPVMRYLGTWGPHSCASLACKRHTTEGDFPLSSTWYRRFFLCFMDCEEWMTNKTYVPAHVKKENQRRKDERAALAVQRQRQLQLQPQALRNGSPLPPRSLS